MSINTTKALQVAKHTAGTLAELVAMLELVKDVRSETAGPPDYLRHIETACELLRRAAAEVSRNAVMT
jgi:hypothetical protein